MLEEVRLRDFGVIDEAVLELGAGLVAITGETGAGKTMISQALELLVGARADSTLVRAGARRAIVDGQLRASTTVAERAEGLGGELDDGALIVTRLVGADGRSRAQVGGISVPVGTLASLLGDRVVMHAQTDQLELLSKSAQREVLDRYADIDEWPTYRDYQDGYRRLGELNAELDEITTRSRERAREADLLRHGIAEIGRAEPKPGEEQALVEERDRLANVDALRTAVTDAHHLLADDRGALEQLAVAAKAIGPTRLQDATLAAVADQLQEALAVASDAAGVLAAYDLDVDPARLEEVGERLALLRSLTRKYGADIEAVLEWKAAGETRLSALENDDARVTEITTDIAELRETLSRHAAALSSRRVEAGDQLAAEVTNELSALAMPQAKLVVRVDRAPEQDGLEVDGATYRFGPHGVDDVTFLLVPHRGAEARPLARAASGGELSRVMLGLELALADAHPVETFVFDEVDAGVGGEAAVEIGRRLARLAGRAQVIVITHLPQIAAFADHHLAVAKDDDTAVVRRIDGSDRVRELSRMLAGRSESTLAHGHAAELLAAAAGAKHAS